MKTRTLKQTVLFLASPDQIYSALLDSKQHTSFTGARAKITPKVGGTFSTYDEYAKGKTLKLIKNKKIVQEWACSDFPEGHLTIVTYLLEKKSTGTKLIFTQTNLPANQYTSLKKGWNDFYWRPLKEFFKNKK